MQTDDLFKKGITSWNLGNLKEAGKIFEQILVIDPNHEQALLSMGNVLGRIGKFLQAVTLYDRVLKLNPKNILALLNKGLSLHYLTEYDSAIKCFDQVLIQKPENITAIYNKVLSLVKKGEIKRGLELLVQLIRIDYSFKYKAKFDIDFQHLKTNSDFKKIIA